MIGCGLEHCVFSTENKIVYGFGNNNSNELGFSNISEIHTPRKIDQFCGLNIKTINLGWYHTFILVKSFLFYFYFIFFYIYFVLVLFSCFRNFILFMFQFIYFLTQNF